MKDADEEAVDSKTDFRYVKFEITRYTLSEISNKRKVILGWRQKFESLVHRADIYSAGQHPHPC